MSDEQQAPRAIICAQGVPAFGILAQRLRSEGFDVLLALPKCAPPMHGQAAEWCLHLDDTRPESVGLIARFCSNAQLIIDAWGLPEVLPFVAQKIDVHTSGAQAKDPEVDAGSLLLALAGHSETVVIGNSDSVLSSQDSGPALRTYLDLTRLGLAESQIMALSAEMVI